MSEIPAILLMGPTGAGKTALAAELVQRWPLEIVSVDSAMVFRGMDIGTAKPDASLLARAPHHLIDLLDPAERYSVGQFLQDANAAMQDILSRGRVPLLVGGTMLYFRALQSGLAILPKADASVRAMLEERASREGWPAMHAELARLDPQAAARIQPQDRQRIQRALEVIEISGQSLSGRHRQDLRAGIRSSNLRLVLAPADRPALALRLAERFRQMMARGFLDEVRRLHARPELHAEMPALRLVGYRQLWAHLDGEGSLEQAVERGIIATRQLARRQYTWLRAEPSAEWFDALESGVSGRISTRVGAWLASFS